MRTRPRAALTLNIGELVRVKGLEPPRQRRQNLNLVRLPVPPHPHAGRNSNSPRAGEGGLRVFARVNPAFRGSLSKKARQTPKVQ